MLAKIFETISRYSPRPIILELKWDRINWIGYVYLNPFLTLMIDSHTNHTTIQSIVVSYIFANRFESIQINLLYLPDVSYQMIMDFFFKRFSRFSSISLNIFLRTALCFLKPMQKMNVYCGCCFIVVVCVCHSSWPNQHCVFSGNNNWYAGMDVACLLRVSECVECVLFPFFFSSLVFTNMPYTLHTCSIIECGWIQSMYFFLWIQYISISFFCNVECFEFKKRISKLESNGKEKGTFHR